MKYVICLAGHLFTVTHPSWRTILVSFRILLSLPSSHTLQAGWH